MDFSTIKNTFDRLSKKRKLESVKTQEVIDRVLQEIEQTAEQLVDCNECSKIEETAFLTRLQTQLSKYEPLTQLGAAQREVNQAFNQYGKLVEKYPFLDIAKAYRDIEFDGHSVNKIIALHFYRQGQFELGDCFIDEAQETNAAILRAPFVEMHQILEGIKDRNLKPALEWTRLHHSELNEKGSCLEFKLQQLQFVHILLESGRLAALQHARSSFKYYATLHMGEIQRLMGCLLWAKRLDCCPYRDLLDPKHWEVILIEFTKEFCNLIGQAYNSPLYVTILAGCEALPSLIKLASSVMANRISEWQSLKQLPVEIQLPNSLQFHSIFSCPVSRDQSTADNPPMLMPCGHVLCRQSIQKLAKGPSQSFKCPYCPLEAYISNCRQINF